MMTAMPAVPERLWFRKVFNGLGELDSKADPARGGSKAADLVKKSLSQTGEEARRAGEGYHCG